MSETTLLQQEQRDRERAAFATLHREGWRFCDIAACNCGSWHRPASREAVIAQVIAEIRESATRNDDSATAAEKIEKNEEGYQMGHTAGWERGVAFGKRIVCQRIEALLREKGTA